MDAVVEESKETTLQREQGQIRLPLLTDETLSKHMMAHRDAHSRCAYPFCHVDGRTVGLQQFCVALFVEPFAYGDGHYKAYQRVLTRLAKGQLAQPVVNTLSACLLFAADDEPRSSDNRASCQSHC